MSGSVNRERIGAAACSIEGIVHNGRFPAASRNINATILALLADIPGPERKTGKRAFSSYRGFSPYR